MLPKRERLNLKKGVSKNIFRARSLTNSYFRVYFRKSDSFKAAAVVPVKQIKKAAQRNQLKRKVYAVLEKSTLRRKKLHLLVMLVKPIADDFSLINQELQTILDKVALKIN
jgi:ribonuclease P protein component